MQLILPFLLPYLTITYEKQTLVESIQKHSLLAFAPGFGVVEKLELEDIERLIAHFCSINSIPSEYPASIEKETALADFLLITIDDIVNRLYQGAFSQNSGCHTSIFEV